MDRTNWKFGKLNINFLTIGIAYRGYALPLAWVNLKKAGNSRWTAWIIGRLGGWKGYASERPAGNKTMSLGLRRFYDVYQGWLL